jgi:hypothetical protein
LRLLGVERRGAHHLGEHVNGALDAGRRERDVIVRVIVARRRVADAADVLDLALDLPEAEIGRPLEHHVFEEMGDAADLRRLPRRTDADPDIGRDDGDFAVLADEQRQIVFKLNPLNRPDRSAVEG